MLTTTMRPRPTRLALTGAATLATVALLTTGPAQARVETPQDTGTQARQDTVSVAAPARVRPTRIAGLYGVPVTGGWLLR